MRDNILMTSHDCRFLVHADNALLTSPHSRTNKFVRAPVCLGSRLWNDLPVKTRLAETKCSFKNQGDDPSVLG